MVWLSGATVLLAVLTACGGTPQANPPTGGTTGTGPPSSVGVPAPPAVATDVDNGHTMTVAVGQRLEVRLSSTYWQFDTGAMSPALRPVGAPDTSPTKGCPPGTGCGTVIATFQAAAPGQATVTATRTSCGEAMRCGAGNGVYRLAVVITG